MVRFAVYSLRGMTVAALGCLAMAGMTAPAAQARVFIGLGVPFYGPGYFPPPPVYYPPPPVYYPPPPAYYPQPPAYYPQPPTVYAPPPAYSPPAPSPGGQMCYAGSYSCPMDRPVATGGGCYCLGNGGQKVWGRAN